MSHHVIVVGGGLQIGIPYMRNFHRDFDYVLFTSRTQLAKIYSTIVGWQPFLAAAHVTVVSHTFQFHSLPRWIKPVCGFSALTKRPLEPCYNVVC